MDSEGPFRPVFVGALWSRHASAGARLARCGSFALCLCRTGREQTVVPGNRRWLQGTNGAPGERAWQRHGRPVIPRRYGRLRRLGEGRPTWRRGTRQLLGGGFLGGSVGRWAATTGGAWRCGRICSRADREAIGGQACCTRGAGHGSLRLPRPGRPAGARLVPRGAQRLRAAAGGDGDTGAADRPLGRLRRARRGAARRDPWLFAALAGVLMHVVVDFDLQIPAITALFVVLAALPGRGR
jgi:hypothetical protein